MPGISEKCRALSCGMYEAVPFEYARAELLPPQEPFDAVSA